MPQTRRDFIKTTSLATAAATVSFPALVGAQEKKAINAVIIGVGGRGSGAGDNFLKAAKAAGVTGKIVAVADIFPDAAKNAAKKFEVADDCCFSGFAICRHTRNPNG